MPSHCALIVQDEGAWACWKCGWQGSLWQGFWAPAEVLRLPTLDNSSWKEAGEWVCRNSLRYGVWCTFFSFQHLSESFSQPSVSKIIPWVIYHWFITLALKGQRSDVGTVLAFEQATAARCWVFHGLRQRGLRLWHVWERVQGLLHSWTHQTMTTIQHPHLSGFYFLLRVIKKTKSPLIPPLNKALLLFWNSLRTSQSSLCCRNK